MRPFHSLIAATRQARGWHNGNDDGRIAYQIGLQHWGMEEIAAHSEYRSIEPVK